MKAGFMPPTKTYAITVATIGSCTAYVEWPADKPPPTDEEAWALVMEDEYALYENHEWQYEEITDVSAE